MCGICGYIGRADRDLIDRMTDVMAHRGPDDRGTHFEEGVGLGQRRLSIIDTSPRGNQPMCNEDGTLWLVYNGEIYNHRMLREELVRLGHAFRSGADTEVVLHAYEEFGDACLERFNGMFSFALWDRTSGRLLLGRDRLGIKPLYYMPFGGGFYFASEIKSLLLVPGFRPEVNPIALDRYLTFRYVTHTDQSMVAGIRRLPPAHILVHEAGKVSSRRYWSIPSLPLEEGDEPDPRESAERYRELLEDSVRLRLASDVPLGVYLSGGLDSSAVLGMMAHLGRTRIKTFSIGFGSEIDELGWAGKVADHFGTDHHETLVRSEDLDLLEKIVWHLDEPVGDAIIIPMFLLAGLARESVRVVLTGEGADETLGGYVHHLALHYGERLKKAIPQPLAGAFRKGLGAVPEAVLDRLFPYPSSLGREGKERLLDYMFKPGDLFTGYLSLASLFSNEEKGALYSPELLGSLGSLESDRPPLAREMELQQDLPLNRVIRHDLRTWLPDQILFKLDKITMAHSIEGRVPFLDHRMVELTAALGAHHKIRRMETKTLLRRACRGLVPDEVIRRKKEAFFIPVETCFRHSFFDFIEEVLSKESIGKRGYFRYNAVRRLIDRYRANPRELVYSKQVMALVILELWHRVFIDAAAGAGTGADA